MPGRRILRYTYLSEAVRCVHVVADRYFIEFGIQDPDGSTHTKRFSFLSERMEGADVAGGSTSLAPK